MFESWTKIKKNKQMKKYIVFLLTFLFLNNLTAQQEANCLLWEISGNGLSKPSYLFGTIHLIPKKEFFFYDNWLEKLEECEVLVLETDIDLSISEQLALVPKMELPEGKKIKDFMSPEEFKAFDAYLTDSLEVSSITHNVCMSYKPFFAYSMIINDVLPSKKVIYEQYLSKKAKKNKMYITKLEELEFQFGLVEEIPIPEQIKLFLFDAEKPVQTNIKKEYEKTLQSYKKQDLSGIASLEQENQDNDDFYEKFLVNRNRDWIAKIKAITSKKSSFIAVGAAHLPGKVGVIALLRKEGYTLKPVFGKNKK